MANSDDLRALEKEIADLEETLAVRKRQLYELKKDKSHAYSGPFNSEEVVRYSRQMILPQISTSGQIALKNSRVLIVGAGGLGCPAAQYLAAAGVGEIHIMDYDEVELSNLHRQILHTEADLGKPKSLSACDKLTKINSNVAVVPIHIQANSNLAEEMEINRYNVVLDCSDNPPTRYLLNDLCVLKNVPLVSGSALQMEGQLTVYHYQNGPCYRCLFPTPPPAHTVTNCGDGGVLGAVAGVIGVLQALEAIKIIVKMEGVLSGRLLLFDGSDCVFRNVKLRQKRAECAVCGDNPQIISPVDYEQFCGSKANDKIVGIDILKDDHHIAVEELSKLISRGESDNDIVIDVRPELEFLMCKLPNTINVPYSKILKNDGIDEVRKILAEVDSSDSKVYVLCRRGNDSQRTVGHLQGIFPEVKFFNVKGGLHMYSKLIDSSFPVY